jgi:hypothetical protein
MVSKKVKAFALLILVIGVIAAFNLNTINYALSGQQASNQTSSGTVGDPANSPMNAIVFLIILVCAAPFIFISFNWLYHKLNLRAGGNLITAGGKKSLPEKLRRQYALDWLNQNRMADRYLQNTTTGRLEVIKHHLSPMREDAVPWDLFAITTEEQQPNVNALEDDFGILAEHVFYVFTNSFTGESDFRHYKCFSEAKKEFLEHWKMGIMRTDDQGNLLKTMGAEALRGASTAFGMQSYSSGQKADVEKKEGEKDEKKQ